MRINNYFNIDTYTLQALHTHT